MDGLYRGIETSLLACTLILGLAAAATSTLPPSAPAAAVIATTLPMISVTAGEPTE
ncbi:hypothetical protein [Methylobacterium haplocladii]|uniref:Uncharacterized protein n=1 Tax=Methylobacterium haplocladii TaxID=1176176 RepID=A0A512IR77_9HYPH|nr:hypothetical protein [Methylobacterium haplocladii]GEP00191.1 hypothetical protein MHA02_25780 [Methylobacterium haplocladii]GJD83754.1 hypothetical protein HPGCJGGD_1625 [Methylobacterium haplocladii]GLS57963.1 hypothetical protein GCM10007887_06190 [Methylobacterium haplocladii]